MMPLTSKQLGIIGKMHVALQKTTDEGRFRAWYEIFENFLNATIKSSEDLEAVEKKLGIQTSKRDGDLKANVNALLENYSYHYASTDTSAQNQQSETGGEAFTFEVANTHMRLAELAASQNVPNNSDPILSYAASVNVRAPAATSHPSNPVHQQRSAADATPPAQATDASSIATLAALRNKLKTILEGYTESRTGWNLGLDEEKTKAKKKNAEDLLKIVNDPAKSIDDIATAIFASRKFNNEQEEDVKRASESRRGGAYGQALQQCADLLNYKYNALREPVTPIVLVDDPQVQNCAYTGDEGNPAIWAETVAPGKDGLRPSQICGLIRLSNIDAAGVSYRVPSDPVDGSYTSKNVRYTLFKNEITGLNDGIVGKKTVSVVNVENILELKPDLNKVAPEGFIHADDFRRLVLALPKDVDCIQMPLAVTGKGRAHYVQLQIYKDSNGSIAARIIDSTMNPVAIPSAEVEKLLEKNKVELGRILGATNLAVSVSTLYTGEQIDPRDKRCGIYVAGGMRAAANHLLAEGPSFLRNSVASKRIVEREHHHVNTMDPEIYCQSRISVSKAAGAAAKLAADNEVALGGTAATTSLPAFQQGRNFAVEPSTAAFNDTPAETQKTKPTGKGALFEMIDGLKSVTSDTLAKTVSRAMDTYQKSRNDSWRISHLFTITGLDEAIEAKRRIENSDPAVKSAVVIQTIKEILSLGLTKDGEHIEVKNNSRAHHLLKQMMDDGLIDIPDIKSDELVGRKIAVKNLNFASPQQKVPAELTQVRLE